MQAALTLFLLFSGSSSWGVAHPRGEGLYRPRRRPTFRKTIRQGQAPLADCPQEGVRALTRKSRTPWGPGVDRWRPACWTSPPTPPRSRGSVRCRRQTQVSNSNPTHTSCTHIGSVTSTSILWSRSHARSDSRGRLATPAHHASVHTIICTPLTQTWCWWQLAALPLKSNQHKGPCNSFLSSQNMWGIAS